MSGADLRFAYSQARLQARLGARPGSDDWQHYAATRDLGALLQLLRGTALARWIDRLPARPGVHEIERRLRSEWLAAVDEVAAWQPAPWRAGTAWLRWLPYLPPLQKLARGGRPPAWMRGDAVLGSIVAREPRERAAVLARGPLRPLEAGFGATPDVAGAWLRHWRELWPRDPAASRSLASLLRTVVAHLARIHEAPEGATSDDVLRSLERRLVLFLRRHPLSPATAVAYLGLLSLDLRRLRGALSVRSLRENPVAPP
jgi:hypothetical protein